MPNLPWILVIVGSLGNILLGLTTYLKNPKSATSRWFVIFSFLFAAYLFINQLSIGRPDDSSTIFWIRMVMAIAPLIVFSFFMLVNVFPKKASTLSRSIFFISIVTTLTMTVLGGTPLIFANVVPGTNQPIPGKLVFLFPLYNVVFLSWSIAVLIKKFRKATGVERMQLKIFILGAVVMFSLILITNVFLVVVFKISGLVVLVPIYTLIFIASIAYAIVRHRFLDISAIVARAVSYSVLFLVLIIAFAGTLFAITSIFSFEIDQRIISFILAIIIAFSFNPLRNFLENITDKVFFKGQYDTESLLAELTKIMASEIRIEALSEKLLTVIANKMRLTKGAFLLLEKQEIINVEALGFEDERALTTRNLVTIARNRPQISLFEEMEDAAEKGVLRELDITAVVPLNVKNELIGILVLGAKSSGEIYSNQDLEVLEILGPQAAIAMQNAESFLEIQEFSRTLEKKVEERTAELKTSQQKELQLKDEFVFIATHDLKTPVAAINGFVSMIKESKEELSSEMKEDIDSIMEASERLNQLVNDLLQVARSDSGTVEVTVKPVDIVEIIKKSITQVTPAAKKRGIAINTSFGSNSVVMADEAKLKEVIENLASNAVKYNKDNGKVDVTTQMSGANLQIVFADTGIGIPADKQNRVFQKFFRAKTPGTESISGTGLGLFVVRMLIEKMGGHIEFKSEEGKGTTFTFTLPLGK